MTYPIVAIICLLVAAVIAFFICQIDTSYMDKENGRSEDISLRSFLFSCRHRD